jgi:hypothetical protein
MWPFKKKRLVKTIRPTVIDEGIVATFDSQWSVWSFSIGDDEFDVRNEVLDTALFKHVIDVPRWLKDNEAQIDAEISKHLEGRVKWDGSKSICNGIDVSKLLLKQEIEVSYSGGGSWGDIGITILLRSGKVISSEAGD